MQRRTQIALGVFLCLGVATYFQYQEPERGTRVGEKPRPVAKLKKDQIKQVTITAKGHTVTLSRDGQKWMVSSPLRYPADKYAAETMQKKLEELDFGDLITEQPSRHAEFEVTGKKAIRVQVSDGQKTLADFYLGKTIDGYTMVMAADKKAVYQAVGALRGSFERELKHWRDRKVIALKSDEVRKLTLHTAKGTIAIARKDKSAKWTLEAAPITIDKLDSQKINAAISALQTLSTFDFADDVDPAKAGLAEAKERVVVTLADGKSHTLVIGSKQAKDTSYVKTLASKQIFVLKDYTLRSLRLRPIDLKDHVMLTFAAAKASKLLLTKNDVPPKTITFERKDGGWIANGKTKIATPKKVDEAIKALSNLRAYEFARKTPAELGLDSPSWTVEITVDGKPTKIIVGNKEMQSSRGVRIEGKPDVFMLRKFVLDRVLLDPDKYK
jgi:hypothetical protein